MTTKTTEEEKVIETIRQCLKILQRREQEKKAKQTKTVRKLIRRVVK